MQTLRFLIALFYTSNAFAHSAPVTVLPFVQEKNCIYIYCTVNTTDSLRFLFDTGANGSVINSDSKKAAGLHVDGQSLNTGSNGSNIVQQSSSNKVIFGSIEKTDASFTLIPFGTEQFDGVFGTNLMKGHIVEIDYKRKELRFYRDQDKGIDLSGYKKMKLRMIDDYPAVECRLTVDGTAYKGLFGLDSGADDALTIASPFVQKEELNKRMEKVGTATFQGSDGSVYEMTIASCPAICFAGRYLYNVPAGLSTATEGIDASEKLTGFFGNNFLKRFNTIIDFTNETIYFKLNDNLYNSFWE